MTARSTELGLLRAEINLQTLLLEELFLKVDNLLSPDIKSETIQIDDFPGMLRTALQLSGEQCLHKDPRLPMLLTCIYFLQPVYFGDGSSIESELHRIEGLITSDDSVLKHVRSVAHGIFEHILNDLLKGKESLDYIESLKKDYSEDRNFLDWQAVCLAEKLFNFLLKKHS